VKRTRIVSPFRVVTRFGGLILTTLTGWLDASAGLVLLNVHHDGTAEGRFLGTTDSFMPARPHDRPPLPDDIYDWLTNTATTERNTILGPDILDQTIEWDAAFIAQLAAPGAQPISISEDDGPMIDYLVDIHQRAFAALIPQADGTWRVRTAGPVDLWRPVEEAIAGWHQADAPPLTNFDLTIKPGAQTVTLAGIADLQLLLPSHTA
jgi:hypothetical protein